MTRRFLLFRKRSPNLPVSFCDADYLAANPDIAQSVGDGQFRCGAEHWRVHGHRENRRLRRDREIQEPESPLQAASAEPIRPPAPVNAAMVSMNEMVSPTQAASEAEDAFTLDYAAANPDVASGVGREPRDLFAHWRDFGARESRAPYGLRPYRLRAAEDPSALRRRPPFVAFYGFMQALSGLGCAARQYAAAIERAGYATRAVTVREEGDAFETSPPSREGAAGPARVNIFHLNADMAHRFFWDKRVGLLDNSYNIGLWVWELKHFRADWFTSFAAFDEIWTPSEFCREAIAAIAPVPVVVMPHVALVATDGIDLPRSHFGLPADAFVFGCAFDVGSTIERKNPQAAIKAFIKAFPDDPDVCLVLKYHSAHLGAEKIHALHKLAAGRRNIRFIATSLSEAENVAFKKRLDCFVSPHRSEGFGLNIAEAMLLGVPVIATGYSGSADFVNANTAAVIDHRLVEIEEWTGPYPPHALWADPSVDHLARLMAQVRADPAQAQARAREARAFVAERFSLEAVAARMKARLDAIGVLDERAALRRDTPFMAHWGASKALVQRFQPNDVPRFSVITPVYDVTADLLDECIRSVLAQTYGNWELILQDDGSRRPDTLAILDHYRGSDPRIRVFHSPRNMGISAATNAAIEASSGAFLAFLDNDDLLAPNALERMRSRILLDPQVDLLYSDEDKLDASGRRCDPYFKPDWSPEHLESVMYLLHLLVMRKSVALEVGGLREAFSGAQDYDLALRVSRVARAVAHVPEILYHWRMIPGSAAHTVDAKPLALARAERALAEHVAAQGRAADVAADPATGLLRVQDRPPPGEPVTLLILTDARSAVLPKRGKVNLLDNFLRSIAAKTRTACELRPLVVDNANLTRAQIGRIVDMGGRVVSYTDRRRPFNFSHKANFALRQVETEALIFLNDDLEVITPDWVDAMIGQALRPQIGVVGAKLFFPDDTIQHCGVVLGVNGHPAHLYHRSPSNFIGYNGYTHVIRNYLAVTGACMAARLSTLMEVGGFDEALRLDYNDTDLCLKLHKLGYRNVFTPHARLYHFEGQSQSRDEPTPDDRVIFDARWAALMRDDPYYNPNLTRTRLDFSSRSLDA